MNREIKFRAWQDNQMLTQPMSGNYAALRFFGLLYEDAKVMQYTGLKDKNGKEIYEGDKLIWNTVSDRERVVTFKRGAFCMESQQAVYSFFDLDNLACSELEIIGNIYETK